MSGRPRPKEKSPELIHGDAGKGETTRFERVSGKLRTDKGCSGVPNHRPIKKMTLRKLYPRSKQWSSWPLVFRKSRWHGDRLEPCSEVC